jgi:hypothetical protein
VNTLLEPALAIPPSRPPSPLTVAKLLRKPGYHSTRPPKGALDNIDGHFTYSNIGELVSTEHPILASRSSKIQMINEVADTINRLPDNKPITIISLGSGYLAPEQLLHEQLTTAKHQVVRWRLIDPVYAPSGNKLRSEKSLKVRQQFGTGKKDARAFTSTQVYLTKIEKGRLLSDADKKGSVIVLTIDPPTALPSHEAELQKMFPNDIGNLIKTCGRAVREDEINKANVILLNFCDKKDKVILTQLDNLAENLEHGSSSLSSTAMKCFPRKDGAYGFIVGPNLPAPVAGYVKQSIQLGSVNLPQGTAMEKLNALIAPCLNEINAETHFSVRKHFLNDFDRSLETLLEHFAQAEGSLAYAKLEKSVPDIVTLKP